jgi:hypothetical protein
MSEHKKYKNGINNIEKKNNFSVPEGYFENFSSRLQLKLQEEKESKQVRHGIYRISGYQFALAASFIGLIIITYSGIKYLTGDQASSKTPALEIADIINYQIHDIDDNLIYELYDETTLEDSDQKEMTDERILKEMIDYLVVSDIDLQLIAQEL